MKLKQIIRIADQAYSDDGAVERAFAAETGSIDELLVGDSLAVFIAREIKETYDPDSTREKQLDPKQARFKRDRSRRDSSRPLAIFPALNLAH